MAFRPNGVPVTAVPGMPVMGYNQTIVGKGLIFELFFKITKLKF